MSETEIKIDRTARCPDCGHAEAIHDVMGRCWIWKCECGKGEEDER